VKVTIEIRLGFISHFPFKYVFSEVQLDRTRLFFLFLHGASLLKDSSYNSITRGAIQHSLRLR
jgi:hypothetical protein